MNIGIPLHGAVAIEVVIGVASSAALIIGVLIIVIVVLFVLVIIEEGSLTVTTNALVKVN